MKSDIHPKYYPNSKVTCSCGNVFEVGSTKESIKVEICSACHPFFSGNLRIMDTAGRVEKFKARAAKSSTLKTATKKASPKTKAKA